MRMGDGDGDEDEDVKLRERESGRRWVMGDWKRTGTGAARRPREETDDPKRAKRGPASDKRYGDVTTSPIQGEGGRGDLEWVLFIRVEWNQSSALPWPLQPPNDNEAQEPHPGTMAGHHSPLPKVRR